ncbi:hypothetical protein N7507_010162 [Penicillium longicatenatum]|nr:hypothetical protein N7507_010162 [Penicillium longicatenatum]
MGCDYCGPPDATPLAAPSEKTSSCQDSCCDSDDAKPLDTTASGLKEPTPEKPDDCCSPGKCADSKAENPTDAPACCRGKVSPCCDTSCLDRLALRECEVSATAVPGPSSQPNTCGGATDRKACSQHRLSALDRYGATLKALGCICRALVALGQETCCEIREPQSLDGKQCPKKSSARSIGTSLDSCNSNDSVTNDQAAQNRFRLRRGSCERTRFVNKASADACIVSFCPKGKPAKKPPFKSKCSKPCCSEDTPVTAPFVMDHCAKSCHSLEKPVKQPAAQTRRPDSCCSETSHVEESPCKGGCPGSCCPSDQRVKNNDTKSVYADSCCSKLKPVVEPLASGGAGSFCGTAKNTMTKELPNAVSSGSCCKPAKQDIVKTPVTSCAGSRCTEMQPASPQGTCTDACSSSAVPDPCSEIEKASIQVITDIENQSTGKEHIVLSISGMTCTGCETKLNRTLVSVPAIKDLRTSLVLSRAEFNINLRLGSVEEVMKHLERTTEFKCEKVQDQGSSLDLSVPNEPSKFISQKWPDGILEMAPVDKHTVRVAFDPKIVGARDLIEKI